MGWPCVDHDARPGLKRHAERHRDAQDLFVLTFRGNHDRTNDRLAGLQASTLPGEADLLGVRRRARLADLGPGSVEELWCCSRCGCWSAVAGAASLALSAAPWAGPWAAPWARLLRRGVRHGCRSQQVLPRSSRQMHGGAPAHLAVRMFHLNAHGAFRRRRGEGARIPTVRTKRSAPGAVRIERRDGLPRRRQRPLVDCFVERREGAQPPGAREGTPGPI
jgi:hypothetical protein